MKVFLSITAFLAICCLIAATHQPVLTGAHRVNPCTADVGNCYSIQGLYSQLTCPGQHVGTVELDGQSFFLECYGDTK